MTLSSDQQDVSERPEDAKCFEVLGGDGVVRRYARQDFGQVFVSTDPDEVSRQVAVGWLILDEREVETTGGGPSGLDLVPGIGSLRAGGLFDYGAPGSITRYVLGYLSEDTIREMKSQQSGSSPVTDR